MMKNREDAELGFCARAMEMLRLLSVPVSAKIKTLSKGGVIDFTGNIKEIVGHTPFQVFVGALLGIAVPFLMMLIMPVR